MARAENTGAHKCVIVKLNGYSLEAIIDTGAVQSLISRDVIEQAGLKGDVTSSSSGSRFITVSGVMRINHELKDSEL